MKIIELIINDEDEFGVQAISLVDAPAIEENWLTLKSQDLKLQAVDQDKRILIGASLVPNRPIYRANGEEEWYVHISQETVKQVAYKFMRQGYQHNTTFQHEDDLEGNVVVESWIVESETDKSYQYGLNPPIGTWMVAMHIGSQDFWQEYVKSGEVKGFSIEGKFLDAMEADMSSNVQMESYSDYPEAVRNNAKRGRELNEKHGNKCATDVGKQRSADLQAGRPLSVETIKRMFSYLSRAEEYYDPSDSSACGTISYLLWGGKAGLRWSRSKLAELELSEIVRELETMEAELDKIRLQDFATMIVNDEYAIIDDRLAYSSKELAEKAGKDLGIEGVHEHELDGKTWYMVGDTHILKQSYAEVGPRGGVKRSKKAPKSDTPNKNPKGKGSAKGDASDTRSAKVTKEDEEKLQKKSDEFNERYKEKLGYGTTVGMLKAVYQRGLGAFNTSHSPKVKSAKQWAMARVNAFLYLVKNGRPENKKYKQDNDLLPSKHPKSSK